MREKKKQLENKNINPRSISKYDVLRHGIYQYVKLTIRIHGTKLSFISIKKI